MHYVARSLHYVTWFSFTTMWHDCFTIDWFWDPIFRTTCEFVEEHELSQSQSYLVITEQSWYKLLCYESVNSAIKISLFDMISITHSPYCIIPALRDMIPAICRLSRNYVTMSREAITFHVITWHYVTWFLQYAASGYVSATQRTLQLLWFTPWHVWRVWHDAFTTGHDSCDMQHVGTLQWAACGHVPTARRTATTMVYSLNVWHDAFTKWHDSLMCSLWAHAQCHMRGMTYS